MHQTLIYEEVDDSDAEPLRYRVIPMTVESPHKSPHIECPVIRVAKMLGYVMALCNMPSALLEVRQCRARTRPTRCRACLTAYQRERRAILKAARIAVAGRGSDAPEPPPLYTLR